MKLYILGTNSGTEPLTERHHTSWVLETASHLYWFDAGEACGFTGYRCGLDLLAVDKIIISHPHIDHTGGLCNLVNYVKKVEWSLEKGRYFGKIGLYLPDMRLWDALVTFTLCSRINQTEEDLGCEPFRIREGLLFDDGLLKVSAIPNTHFARYHLDKDDQRTFSFLIEGEGKRIVYSADVGSYHDLDPFTEDGCDVLFLETGHHLLETAEEYCRGKEIGKIAFIHHNRRYLNDIPSAKVRTRELFGDKAVFCDDRMVLEV